MRSLLLILWVLAILGAGGCALPIPDGPGIDAVPAFVGQAVKPRPMAPKDVPEHPLLAEQSVFHDDHYNSDVTDFPGPLGLRPRVRTRAYGVCGTPRVDSKGRIITTCANPVFLADPGAQPSLLYLLDPDTLDVLAETEFFLGSFDGDDIGGGNYPHVLADDSVINGGANGKLQRYKPVTDPVTGDISWSFSEPIDFSPGIPAGDTMFDVLPDFDGHYWFATVGGTDIGGVTVGMRDASGAIRTLFLPGERTENGLAVGERGIYLVTDAALYRFDKDRRTGEPVQTWRESYMSVPKPPESGLFSDGSGSTPTLLGRRYIAITDNDGPQINLLVYRRGAHVKRDRQVCKVPLFEPGHSANDLSVIGNRRSIVVTNWYGAPQPYTVPTGQSFPPFFGDYRDMAGGMTRVDILPSGRGCRVVWQNPDVRTNSVPKLSTATGLIYFHGQRIDDTTESVSPPIDAYYMQAVSMRTGKRVFEVLAGTGPYYAGGGLTTTLGPNGAFYQATGGGLYRVQDGWVRGRGYRDGGNRWAKGRIWDGPYPQRDDYSVDEIKEEPLIFTDCTQQTLLPSLIALSQGGAPLCNVAGFPADGGW